MSILNESNTVEKKDVHGRDLLSLLVKSNLATDIPENQRLSSKELLARKFDFVILIALAECFFSLAEIPTYV
jgi:hypothetical protein